jgi:predicted dehydrogenase
MNVRVRAPRLAFVGSGWIGRNRMEAIARDGSAAVACVVDLDIDAARCAAQAVGCDRVGDRFEDALAVRPDGVVIATPNSLHAEQALAALEAGIPVFCQKPLGRNADEARAVVDTARRNDLRLGVDMSYRHVEAFVRAREALRSTGARPYAAELWFHNAYGPDKSWFLDPVLAGGGCALDLGTHLIDLAFWFLGRVRGEIFRRGLPIADARRDVEDYAAIELRHRDAHVRIACSWFLPAGTDALIGAVFYAPDESVAVENVGGSFVDFRAEHRRGRSAVPIAEPPDAWGGRALRIWSEQVALGGGFDPGIEHVVRTAEVLDRVYARSS